MSRRGQASRLLALGIAAISLPALASGDTLPGWRPGPAGDLAFESSAFLRRTSYRKPDKVADQSSPSGAYGPLNISWDDTHRGRWLIEEQRYGFDAIVAGISYGRQDLIERGKAIFDWGFRQERPDGSFDCPDRFHSMSFFLEATAHAALLLQASDLRPQNQSWIDWIKPQLRSAAAWMLDGRNSQPGRAHEAPYTHRYYLDADAIGETGVLLHDDAMVRASRDYVRAGIARQDPSGSNPEKGGSDTSYHAVGLLFALDYYSLVASDELRTQMRPMIMRGLIWLRSRMRADGTVDQTGNTRTGFGQERGPQGNLKTMSYGSAYRASYYWATITGDRAWETMASSLFDGQHVEADARRAGGR